MKILFSERVFGGFWYPPDPRVARSAMRTTRIQKYTVHFSCHFSHGIRFFYYEVEILDQIRDTGHQWAGGYQNPPKTRPENKN